MLGDILSSAASIWNASQNRNAAEDRQNQSEAFSERMSNTTYQRMVEDLNKAGLSPMLAYSKTGSSPTSSPASGTSSIEAPKFGETSLRQSQSALAREQLEVAKSQAALNQSNAAKAAAETRNINADTVNKNEMFGQIGAQTGQIGAQTSQLKGLTEVHGSTAKQLEALIDRIRQEINIHKPSEQFKQENPNIAKYMSPFTDALRTIFEGFGLLRGSSAMPFVTKNAPKGK